jgi:GAF domain-containing protein
MGTRNCSILTVVYGKRGAKPKLVLQRTNYFKSKKDAGTKYYTEGQGLTGWVWKNKRALRLDDLNNEAELLQYEGLEWARVVDDSLHHQEWLGVPLIEPREKEVIGVIRVPEKIHSKREGGGGFSFEDEVLLTAIGQHVARRIEELRACERVQTSLHACQECAVAFSHVRDEGAIAEQIIRACEKIFGTSGKAFVVTLLTEQGDTLQPFRLGGSLVSKKLLSIGFPLTGSLAGYCLRRDKPVIFHDLPRAEKRDGYFPVLKKLKCGMGAPIVFSEKKFGVLTVGSNRQFDFTEEPDLHILSDLASLAAAAFARLVAEQQAQDSLRTSVRGVAHTLGNRIPTLKMWLGILQRKAGNRFKEEIDALNKGIDFVTGAVTAAAQFGRLAKPVNMESFHLSTVLGKLKGLYPDKRVSWHVRGSLPMVGDPRFIEQAVVELLTNALRFISKRKGQVQISAYRTIERQLGMGKGVVVIRVDDNGPGVASDRKERIFQPFKTSDPSAHFGLGLGFVYSVVQRHGGYVKECGTKGRGASFRMIFPQ